MTNLGGSTVSPFSGYPHLLVLRQGQRSSPTPGNKELNRDTAGKDIRREYIRCVESEVKASFNKLEKQSE